ncbi:MAG: IS66 family transposase, partial [Candidatus Acidiferrales bacterium]
PECIKMRKKAIPRIDVPMEELEKVLERARKEPLDEEGYAKLKASLETLGYLVQLVENKDTTIHRLRQMLFGASTEKTSEVLPTNGVARQAENPTVNPKVPAEKASHKGHGRNGAEAYSGAEKVRVVHESLKPGDRCPHCQKGKVYHQAQPGVLVRVVGQAALKATVYELEKLRCNLCSDVYTAKTPEGVGTEKYDETSASMIALLKYGSGLPFHRLERLQGNLGIPLPAATQWEIVKEITGVLKPAYQELIRQAAQGEVVHNDDTTMKILAMMPARAPTEECGEEKSERTGVFTSGIVSTREGRRIALFFTGRKHAGENLAEVLSQRASELGPPIQMCDALSRNPPKEFQVILANCIAHGRRKFVEVAENFPEECRYVLEQLREVYKNDALAREQGMSPEQRLHFHQVESGPRMKELETWFKKQFAERKVEPNSGLGEAILYMQKYWDKLTLFLRQAGAPLDNNIVEQTLKMAILHRKNALFYKTQNGARVGDLFMSLIYTCQLCGANPFDYLTELQKHRRELFQESSEWMPWNYRNALNRGVASDEARS